MRPWTSSGSSRSESDGEAGDVDEEDGDLLALALEGAPWR